MLGMSNVTCLFDLEWQDAHGSRQRLEMVLRCPPREEPLFPDYCLARQFDIPARLQGSGVPVPKMFWLEENPAVIGAPFFVMERLAGAALPDIPSYHTAGPYFDASPKTRQTMWFGLIDVMARLHNLDWRKLGLQFVPVPTEGSHALALQLDYWARYLEWSTSVQGCSVPVLEAALRWLERNAYTPEYTALCWGDARIGNVIYGSDHSVAGLLDWEMAYIGDPEADLAWCTFLDWETWGGAGIDALEGHPDRAATLRRYEAASGRKLRHFFFNEVFAGFKHGSILARMFSRPDAARYCLGMDPRELARDNMVTRRLAAMLQDSRCRAD